MNPIVRHCGYTLIEVLITITIVAILTTLALPSFLDLVDRNRVISAANDLLSGILLARSEAIKQERHIVVERADSGWNQWIVYVDVNNNKSQEANEATLLEHHTSNRLNFTPAGNFGASLSYNSRGRATLSRSDGLKISLNTQTRYLCFSPNGRPRIQENSCS